MTKEIKEYIKEYADKMKNIQEKILEFIENEDTREEDYNEISHFFKESQISTNHNDLKSLLHLISKISKNHKRQHDFFKKIEFILKMFTEEIKDNFDSFTIFNIFKRNKRILLFLFNEKIIIPTESIYRVISGYPTICYFYPEFKSFLPEGQMLVSELKEYLELKEDSESKDFFKHQKDSELKENFELNRQNGNNPGFLCKLIQKDSIDEFIVYINQNNIPLSSTIAPSIFETNLYLIKNIPSIIEYAAFYGSIQIFNYLRFNNVSMDSNLWMYSIHGGNPEIIYLLEENEIPQPTFTYNQCYKESIKCHNLPVMEYMRNNLRLNKKEKDIGLISQCLPYYNFYDFCQIDLVNCQNFEESDIFYFFCKYDYISIVEFIISKKEEEK